VITVGLDEDMIRRYVREHEKEEHKAEKNAKISPYF